MPRREFLYDICFWEAKRILQGYWRRYRNLWSATRWETFYMLNCWAGDSMKKNGIHNPIDLHKFPWEKDVEIGESITEEDAAQLQKDMENWQEFLQQQKGGN